MHPSTLSRPGLRPSNGVQLTLGDQSAMMGHDGDGDGPPTDAVSYGIKDLHTIFALKEHNAGKLNSHFWYHGTIVLLILV
jgi:hypothetical protein